MIEVNFSGPFALLPHDDIALLLADPEAWQPGVYVWTFLWNQVHRLHYVNVNETSIALQHNRYFEDFLAGRRRFYRASEVANGALVAAYEPDDGRDKFVSAFPELMQVLPMINVFFAPFVGNNVALHRIGRGLAAHFQRLGGKAESWLDNDPVEYDPKSFTDALTIRIGRPAFIASMPDEIYL